MGLGASRSPPQFGYRDDLVVWRDIFERHAVVSKTAPLVGSTGGRKCCIADAMSLLRILLAGFVVGVLLPIPRAAAENLRVGSFAPSPPEEPDDLHLDVTFGTHFPVSIGADAQLELPFRLLVRAHLGWMPPRYLGVINAVATGFGWYDDLTADLIASAVDQAFVARAGLGFRPFVGAGFELAAGYTTIVGGGSVTTEEAVEAATGRSFGGGSGEGVPLHTTLHAVHAELGWRWLIGDRWVIRAAMGYVHTLAANTQVGRDRALRREDVDQVIEEAETYLDDVLTTWGFSPELKLMTGFRF